MKNVLKRITIDQLVDWITAGFFFVASVASAYQGENLTALSLVFVLVYYLLATNATRGWGRSLDDQVKLIDALDEANAMLQMYERLCQSQEEQSK